MTTTREGFHTPGQGSSYRHELGCRCDECRTAARAKRRAARDRARAEGRESYFRELAASRVLKRQRVGICERCSGETRYNGSTVNGPSRICDGCNRALSAERQKAKRGQGPTVQRIIAFVSERPRRFTEIVDGLGISKGTAANRLNRLVAYGLLERRSRGLYVIPSANRESVTP